MISQPMRRVLGSAACVTVIVGTGGCGDTSVEPVVPPVETVDAALRRQIAMWGVVPILPMAPQNSEMVGLGQALMFDKILSGNRDVSCATCHTAADHLADGLALSVGTGGTGAGPSRVLGPGRRFVPRNSPSLLNLGLRSPFIFWDGRVSGSTTFTTPARPGTVVGVTNILGAQAMFPVTNREEMRGDPGDLDVFGSPNELAQFADTQYVQIWQAVMQRLLAIPEYVTMFNLAFPQVPTASLGFQHAANAIA